jgi:hypothetical protein
MTSIASTVIADPIPSVCPGHARPTRDTSLLPGTGQDKHCLAPPGTPAEDELHVAARTGSDS